MSKAVWFLAFVFFAIGVAGYFYRDTLILAKDQLSRDPAVVVDWVKAVPLTAWVTITSTVGGIIGTVLFLATRLSQYKQQSQQNLSQVKSELTANVDEQRVYAESAKTELQETTSSYSEKFATLSDNYAKLQTDFQDVSDERNRLVKQLSDERAYFEDRIRKLEAERIEAQRVA